MHSAKEYLYLVVVLCFVTVSCAFHVGSERGSKSIDSGIQKDTSQQEGSAAQNQPRISFDSTKYDAGEVWEGDEITHTFMVRNTGTAQLNLEKMSAG